MGFQERLLMRKIRKTAEHKINVFKQRNRNIEESKTEGSPSEKTEDNLKRGIEFEDGQPHKKRKLTDETIEVENENIPITDIEEPTEKLKFDSLNISENTKKAIADMGFTYMTEIQAKTIPKLLNGLNLVGEAKTGSGKTLAFLIPIVEILHFVEFKARNGTGAIILSPTRELSMQTYGVLKNLVKYHSQTIALLIGGASKKLEAEKVANGANIIVATPGRLLYHLQNTEHFHFKNLSCLVVDEMDKIMNIGFTKEINQIMSILPKSRQTILFSATNIQQTEALKALKVDQTLYVRTKVLGIGESTSQGSLICPSEKRLATLYTFLKKNKNKKVMVFFSSCASVEFHDALFRNIDLDVMCIHGQLKQEKRTTKFFQFCRAEKGILLCTDVASRGLDFPAVDWILQYDPPNDPVEYVHRVGRTARGEGTRGKGIIMLTPEESCFEDVLIKVALKDSKLWRFELSCDIEDIQELVMPLIGRNHFLKSLAMKAFSGYMKAYESHKLKDIFDSSKLDLKMVANSFGLRFVPNIGCSMKDSRHKIPNRKERRQLERERQENGNKYTDGKGKIVQNFSGTDTANNPHQPNRKERRKQQFS